MSDLLNRLESVVVDIAVAAIEDLARYAWNAATGQDADASSAVDAIKRKATDAAIAAMSAELDRQAVLRQLPNLLAGLAAGAAGVVDAFTPDGSVPDLGLTIEPMTDEEAAEAKTARQASDERMAARFVASER
jgi:hypothetical protein